MQSLQPRSSVAKPPPLSARSEQFQFGADSDPSQANDVNEEMNALYSTFQTDTRVSHNPFPPDPSTSSDLQSYDHIISITLTDLGKSELLVLGFSQIPFFLGVGAGGPGPIWECGLEHRPGYGAGTDQGFSGAFDDIECYGSFIPLQGAGGIVLSIV